MSVLTARPAFREVRSSLRRTVAPSGYPVDIDDVLCALDVYDQTDTGLRSHLESYLADAVEQVERHAERALLSQTWALYLDEFPDEIELRRPPVTAVSSIAYVDDSGDSQTLSASLYETDLAGAPARIIPAYGEVWPHTQCGLNNVTVTFVTGSASSASVPRAARQAILIAVKQMYHGCDLSAAYWQAINDLQWAGRV